MAMKFGNFFAFTIICSAFIFNMYQVSAVRYNIDDNNYDVKSVKENGKTREELLMDSTDSRRELFELPSEVASLFGKAGDAIVDKGLDKTVEKAFGKDVDKLPRYAQKQVMKEMCKESNVYCCRNPNLPIDFCNTVCCIVNGVVQAFKQVCFNKVPEECIQNCA